MSWECNCCSHHIKVLFTLLFTSHSIPTLFDHYLGCMSLITDCSKGKGFIQHSQICINVSYTYTYVYIYNSLMMKMPFSFVPGKKLRNWNKSFLCKAVPFHHTKCIFCWGRYLLMDLDFQCFSNISEIGWHLIWLCGRGKRILLRFFTRRSQRRPLDARSIYRSSKRILLTFPSTQSSTTWAYTST